MVDKREVILGLVMFFVNLIWAVSQQWSVTDLLWSLWISSLLIGYSYILVSILASLVVTDARIFVFSGFYHIEFFFPEADKRCVHIEHLCHFTN